jgi:hypothetical protein
MVSFSHLPMSSFNLTTGLIEGKRKCSGKFLKNVAWRK